MNTLFKKLLDFTLIFLLVFFTMKLFTADSSPVELNGKVLFSSIDKSYSIPASVEIKVENNSAEVLSFNTCNDQQLSSAGDIIELSPDLCEDILVESGEQTTIAYGAQYDKFTNPWTYQFNIQLPQKEVPIVVSFEITNKWIFSKIFTAFVYAPMYNGMIFLLELFAGSLGWAIIAITIIIRIVLMYPQHKMMVSQKKLQAIQPKIKEIQKKYKGKQQELWIKLMELYKKEKVNPMGSCGFLLIQMPILLVIYHIILWIQDPVHYYHVYSMLQSFQLSDINFNFFGLDLLAAGGLAWVLLGLSVGAIQYLQVKLSLSNNKTTTASKKDIVLEKKAGANDYSSFMPDPEVMNKFMLYGMPAMVAVFTYSLFAWVGVYWWVSTLFMTLQQFVVNKMIKKQK